MGTIPIDASLAREALERGGVLSIRVRGGSMGPWLRSGDEVVIVPIAPGSVKRGEILVFERDHELIAHRAVRREQRGWITRGDAVDTADPWVSDDQIIGCIQGLHLRWIQMARPSTRLRSVIGRAILRVSPLLNRARKSARGSSSIRAR